MTYRLLIGPDRPRNYIPSHAHHAAVILLNKQRFFSDTEKKLRLFMQIATENNVTSVILLYYLHLVY